MYKIFDVQCQECDFIEEIFKDDEQDFPICSECGGKTKRIYTSMNFKLVYNNKTDSCSWGDHGYASSQYWNNVKDARANGENVKAPDE